MRRILNLYPLFILIIIIGWYFAIFNLGKIQYKNLEISTWIGPFIVIYVWLMSIYDFQYHELKMKNPMQYILVNIVLLGLMSLGLLRFAYTDVQLGNEPGGMSLYNLFNIISIVLYLGVATIFFLITRKYLYARSPWFVFVEILAPIVGIMTLSPTLLQEKKEAENGMPPEGDELV